MQEGKQKDIEKTFQASIDWKPNAHMVPGKDQNQTLHSTRKEQPCYLLPLATISGLKCKENIHNSTHTRVTFSHFLFPDALEKKNDKLSILCEARIDIQIHPIGLYRSHMTQYYCGYCRSEYLWGYSVATVTGATRLAVGAEVLCHNSPLFSLLEHSFLILNHDWNGHNTKAMK